MKNERVLSCPAETFQLNEARTTNVNRLIIVPYGYPKNFDMTTAEQGDILVFKDDKRATIEGICEVSTASPMFDALCHLVYGISAIGLMKQWKEKFQDDIQYDTAVVITYNAKFL